MRFKSRFPISAVIFLSATRNRARNCFLCHIESDFSQSGVTEADGMSVVQKPNQPKCIDVRQETLRQILVVVDF